ncbi:DUF6204 family protein [Streptomyces sp. NPDC056930]|uniref:DUF6204 family protein n=1 Tax=Streptomyces sp. NPDC056930 TaxID=3345967 RepID=UPI003634A37A
MTVKHIARIAIRNTRSCRSVATTARSCAHACPPTPSPRAARKPRSASPSGTWCQPRSTCARNTGTSRHCWWPATHPWPRSTGGCNGKPGGSPPRCSPRNASGCILCPQHAFTAAFGQSRLVGKDATIQVDAVRYSVPHALIEQSVWVRFHGDDLIVTAMIKGLPVEVARHTRSTEEAAKTWLAEHGYGYKNLRSNAEDLSQAPLSKRQRRAAAQKNV